MGKLGYVLLGIVLTLGALSLGGYRHFYSPSRGHHAAQTRSVAAPQVGQRDRSANAPTLAAAPAATQVSTAQMFDWALNGANLLVGLVGIWLAVKGVRRRA